MLTATAYQGLKRKLAIYRKWSRQYRKPNGWTVIPAGAKPPVHLTNNDRSEVEVYEFVNDPPERYLLYISEENRVASTWTGQPLGEVEFGRTWRDNFGGLRRAVRVKAINGATYSGTYFKSSGDYATVKRVAA